MEFINKLTLKDCISSHLHYQYIYVEYDQEISVMSNLDELAKKYKAFVESDRKGFRRKARILQAIWRTEKDYPIGKNRGEILGSRLQMPWAKETLPSISNPAAVSSLRPRCLAISSALDASAMASA